MFLFLLKFSLNNQLLKCVLLFLLNFILISKVQLYLLLLFYNLVRQIFKQLKSFFNLFIKQLYLELNCVFWQLRNHLDHELELSLQHLFQIPYQPFHLK